MGIFNFLNKIAADNAAEIKAVSDGCSAAWDIGSKLTGIAADCAADIARGVYTSFAKGDAEEASLIKSAEEYRRNVAEHMKLRDKKEDLLMKQIQELQRQNEALRGRLEFFEAEKEADEEQSCLDAEKGGEEYCSGAEVYENTPLMEIVSQLAGVGEAYAVQAMHYLINKYPKGMIIPWVKIDGKERCVTVLRPEGGFAYVGDSSVEEMM